MQPAPSDIIAQTISVISERRVICVTMSDGRRLEVGADRLRMHCRCAVCTRARIDGTFIAAGGVRIEQVTPIGQYGVNIAFSDGHARGIFPVAYLAELAAFEASGDDSLSGPTDHARQAAAT